MGVTFGAHYAHMFGAAEDAIQAGARVSAEIPQPSIENGGMLEAALWWARNVANVIPLTQASRDPADTHAGKRPNGRVIEEVEGTRDDGRTAEEWGTRNEERIRAWWAVQPLANVGITTQASGILIVDVDPRHGGWDAFLPWCERHGVDLSDVPRSASPRDDGGQHLWWRVPAGASFTHSSLMKGVDRPWQVPVPPSMRYVVVDRDSKDRNRTHDFRPYRWLAGEPRVIPVAPDVLLQPGESGASDALAGGDGVSSDSVGATDDGRGRIGAAQVDALIESGVPLRMTQNFVFKRMACSLIRRQWTTEDIVTALMDSASRSEQDPSWPWTEADMRRIERDARSFMRRVREKEDEQNRAIAQQVLARWGMV